MPRALQLGSQQGWAEGHRQLPWPAGHTAFGGAQDRLGFLAVSALCEDPQLLLLRAALNPFSSSLCWCLGSPQLPCRTLHLALLKFTRVPLDGCAVFLKLAALCCLVPRGLCVQSLLRVSGYAFKHSGSGSCSDHCFLCILQMRIGTVSTCEVSHSLYFSYKDVGFDDLWLVFLQSW